MIRTITKSGVREVAKQENLNVGSEVYEAVDEAVVDLLVDAAERARANGRRTIKARDV